MTGYLLGIDAGTTSFKLALYTDEGAAVHMVKEEYVLLTQKAGWVEYKAEDYWALLCRLLRRLLAESGIPPEQILSLAVSSQGETLICLDECGRPVMNAICWLDNRSEKEAGRIRAHFGKKLVYEKSGQADVTATWPATKILWLKEERPDIFQRTKCYLLLEDYLIYRLTGCCVCEENLWASSLLYDINRDCWWGDMLRYLGITQEQLPERMGCGRPVGPVSATASGQTGLSGCTLVVTGALDQTCGSIGAGKIFPGEVTETTGSCLAVSAVAEGFVPYCEERPVTCQNHAVKGRYTILLWSQTAGMVLKWYAGCFLHREALEGADIYRLIDREAELAPAGSEGLVMLPHLSGASNPEYNAMARGVFYGMTLGHERKHFSRAILEAVAYMLRRNVEQIEGIGETVSGIYSMGGGAKSDIWCRIKADVTGKKVETIPVKECACLGAALLAGVGAGVFPDIDSAVRRVSGTGRVFVPAQENRAVYDRGFAAYIDLYHALEPVFGKYGN